MKEEEVDEVFDEPGSDPGALKDIVRVVKSPYSAPNLNDLQGRGAQGKLEKQVERLLRGESF